MVFLSMQAYMEHTQTYFCMVDFAFTYILLDDIKIFDFKKGNRDRI